MKLTCIVPYRNLPELLPRCLDSIAHQDFHCQVIVIDNASDRWPYCTGSVEHLRHITDKGLIYSLNEGFAMASTEYCCFVMADDTIEPDWFRIGVALLEANPLAWFVAPDTEAELKWPEILYQNYMHMGAIFRKQALVDVGGYRDGPFFDWDLWIRLAKAGYQGISLSKHFYNWLPRAGSYSTQITGDEYAKFTRQIQEMHK